MNGVEGVLGAVVQSISAHTEQQLAAIEAELGPFPYTASVTPRTVWDAQLPYDSVGIDDWPFVLVIPQGDPKTTRYDVIEDGTKVYDVLYDLTVFIWVRGDSFRETGAVQRRTTLAIKQVLLAYQKLSPTMGIDETSLVVKYSDVAVDTKLAATIAASSITLRAHSREQLAPNLPPYGPIQSADATAKLLAPAVPQPPQGE